VRVVFLAAVTEDFFLQGCGALYRGADKSLSRPGRKQVRKHVGDAHDFNNIETRASIKFFFFFFFFREGKGQKKIYAILTRKLTCFFPGWV